MLLAGVPSMPIAFAQNLSVGLMGGVSLTNAYPTETVSSASAGAWRWLLPPIVWYSPHKDYPVGATLG